MDGQDMKVVVHFFTLLTVILNPHISQTLRFTAEVKYTVFHLYQQNWSSNLNSWVYLNPSQRFIRK